MYKLCKTEQSALRQRQLEAGLLSAMEGKRYEEISISDLCQQLNIPRKAFYRYFSGKDGALHALLDHTLLEFDSQENGFMGMRGLGIRSEMERFFSYWLAQRRLLDALDRSGLSGLLVMRAMARAQLEHAAPIMNLSVQEQLVRSRGAAFLSCGLMSMVIEWHHNGFRETPQEIAWVAVQILTRPLIPDISRNNG